MTENKRAVERTPVTSEIVGNVTVFQAMTILNLSEAGIQIETPYKLQNDSLHDFRLSLGDRSVVVKGRIVYCQVGELSEERVIYRSGVEFVTIPPHALAAVREFVAVHNGPPTAILDGEIA
jgi:hypothetical protein